MSMIEGEERGGPILEDVRHANGQGQERPQRGRRAARGCRPRGTQAASQWLAHLQVSGRSSSTRWWLRPAAAAGDAPASCPRLASAVSLARDEDEPGGAEPGPSDVVSRETESDLTLASCRSRTWARREGRASRLHCPSKARRAEVTQPGAECPRAAAAPDGGLPPRSLHRVRQHRRFRPVTS
jgi:hypothetical protein